MQRQAVLLQSSGIGFTCLALDSHAVASCGTSKTMAPLPLPGRHTLTLTDGHGKVLDVHSFEVRALTSLRGGS